MEEALAGPWEPLGSGVPAPLNPAAAFLAPSGWEKEADAVAEAFSCAAFTVERVEGGREALQKLLPLPGGGVRIFLRAGSQVPLACALLPLLPEEASLFVFDPGRVEIKEDLYSMCSCYITDADSREVLKSFSALRAAGEKAIDASWERGRDWRERAFEILSGARPDSFFIETGRLDAETLLLAGWAKEEFGIGARIVQAPSFEESVRKISFSLGGKEAFAKAGADGKSIEVSEGGRVFKCPKENPTLAEILKRQMGLLPPDPSYGKSLSFEIEGVRDVG